MPSRLLKRLRVIFYVETFILFSTTVAVWSASKRSAQAEHLPENQAHVPYVLLHVRDVARIESGPLLFDVYYVSSVLAILVAQFAYSRQLRGVTTKALRWQTIVFVAIATLVFVNWLLGLTEGPFLYGSNIGKGYLVGPLVSITIISFVQFATAVDRVQEAVGD